MSFLGRMLGTQEAANNLLDKDDGLLVKAGHALNELHYSEQEKDENSAKRRDEFHAWSISMLKALEPMPIMQRTTRHVALMAAGGWLIGLFLMFAGMIIESLTCPDPELLKLMSTADIDLSIKDAMSCVRFDHLLQKFLTSEYAFWPILGAFFSLFPTATEVIIRAWKGN